VKPDLAKRLESGQFDDDDVSAAYEMLFEKNSYGKDHYYQILLKCEFEKNFKCPLC
jgi:hypothetical protein